MDELAGKRIQLLKEINPKLSSARRALESGACR